MSGLFVIFHSFINSLPVAGISFMISLFHHSIIPLFQFGFLSLMLTI